MTARQIYEAVLIELNKNNAPSLRLHEFNYLFNKAINEFVDEAYQAYDTSQTITDSLRVLQSEASLTPQEVKVSNFGIANIANTNKLTALSGAIYEVLLPEDYLHLLNCTCVYQLMEQNRCYNKDDCIQVPATKLTSDSWSNIMTDVYNRPSPMKPYYYLHNRNYQQNMPTNSYVPKDNKQSKGSTQGNDIRVLYLSQYPKANGELSDVYSYDKQTWFALNDNTQIANLNPTLLKDIHIKTEAPFSRTINLNDYPVSVVEKPAAVRFANPQQVRMEIRYGRDKSVYKLIGVVVDYVKAPQFIRLTQDEIDLTSDTSQIMEYPDFVCQKIINKLVALLLERSSDPRLTTNVQINRTMVSPAQPQSAQN